MAKDLQISAPPDTMRSLPLRLARLENSLGTVLWPGQPMRLNFPIGEELTADERKWISDRLKALEGLITGSGDDPKACLKARLSLLTKLLLGYPTAGTSDKASDARMGFYLEAVGDVAPWVLDAAIKRWVRGEVENANVDFAPSPGSLRRICDEIVAPYKTQARQLARLESAMPVERAMDPSPIKPLALREVAE